MRQRAFITGINGFAGRWLARELAGQGFEVAGLMRPGTDAAGFPELGQARLFVGDLLDQPRLADHLATTRPNRVYHLAAAANAAQAEAKNDETFEINLLGTVRLLEAVRSSCRSARVLVVSSGAVYGDAGGDRPIDESIAPLPTGVYSASKLAAEEAARAAVRDDGLHVVIVRPFNHTGPGQASDYVAADFARQCAAIARAAQPPRITAGNVDVVRDFSDVRDVVRAYHLALERGDCGATYNVASGRGLRLRDIIETLAAFTGRTVEISVDPGRLRARDVPKIIGSAARLQAAAAWSPRLPFERTLRDLFDHWSAVDAAGRSHR